MLTIDAIETMFLGSDIFPVRTSATCVLATRNGVVLGTVKIVDGAIVIKGDGKRADANAKRISKILGK